MPAGATIAEDVRDETNLFPMVVTDASLNDFVDCVVSATSPTTTVFFAKIDSVTSGMHGYYFSITCTCNSYLL